MGQSRPTSLNIQFIRDSIASGMFPSFSYRNPQLAGLAVFQDGRVIRGYTNGFHGGFFESNQPGPNPTNPITVQLPCRVGRLWEGGEPTPFGSIEFKSLCSGREMAIVAGVRGTENRWTLWSLFHFDFTSGVLTTLIKNSQAWLGVPDQTSIGRELVTYQQNTMAPSDENLIRTYDCRDGSYLDVAEDFRADHYKGFRDPARYFFVVGGGIKMLLWDLREIEEGDEARHPPIMCPVADPNLPSIPTIPDPTPKARLFPRIGRFRQAKFKATDDCLIVATESAPSEALMELWVLSYADWTWRFQREFVWRNHAGEGNRIVDLNFDQAAILHVAVKTPTEVGIHHYHRGIPTREGAAAMPHMGDGWSDMIAELHGDVKGSEEDSLLELDGLSLLD